MIIVSFHTPNSQFTNRIQYVLDGINAHPLKPGYLHFNMNDTDANSFINYGSDKKPCYFDIPRQDLIFSKEVQDAQLFHLNSYSYKKMMLYGLENDKKKASEFIQNGQFAFDILESLFFHWSRYEEFYCPNKFRDKWDMMFEKHQLLVKSKLHRIPVVDQLIFHFIDALGFKVQSKPTTLNLSHDIDVLRKFRNPYRLFRSVLRSILNRKNPIRLIVAYFQSKYFGKKDPFDNKHWLLVSDHACFKQKVIYFMSGGETIHDNHYKIHSKTALSWIESAKKSGYKIGLHGSYNSAAKSELLNQEKRILEEVSQSKIRHNRQHFLHFLWPSTPEIIDATGILFDSSIGYQRLIGFRAGTGFSFKLYNFTDEKAYKFIEIPMIVMDGALLNENENDEKKAILDLDDFLEQNGQNTQITFNIHNTIFDPFKRNNNVLKMKYLGSLRSLEEENNL